MSQREVPGRPHRSPRSMSRLRLWPGVVIVGAQWLAWFGLPFVASDFVAGVIGAGARLAGGSAVLVWDRRGW